MEREREKESPPSPWQRPHSAPVAMVTARPSGGARKRRARGAAMAAPSAPPAAAALTVLLSLGASAPGLLRAVPAARSAAALRPAALHDGEGERGCQRAQAAASLAPLPASIRAFPKSQQSLCVPSLRPSSCPAPSPHFSAFPQAPLWVCCSPPVPLSVSLPAFRALPLTSPSLLGTHFSPSTSGCSPTPSSLSSDNQRHG